MIVCRYFHKGAGNNCNLRQGPPGIWFAHTEFVGLQVVAWKSWVMHQQVYDIATDTVAILWPAYRCNSCDLELPW